MMEVVGRKDQTPCLPDQVLETMDEGGMDALKDPN